MFTAKQAENKRKRYENDIRRDWLALCVRAQRAVCLNHHPVRAVLKLCLDMPVQ
jgi:hypothetical protein